MIFINKISEQQEPRDLCGSTIVIKRSIDVHDYNIM